MSSYIFLGLGNYYGLVAEATLKMKEMTQTPCEYYNPLEFRHGPISILTPQTLVVVLSGNRGLDTRIEQLRWAAPQTLVVVLSGNREEPYVRTLVRDVVGFDAQVALVSPVWSEIPAKLKQHVPLSAELTDWSRAVLYMPMLQMLAYYRALKLELNPDEPRNLNQVVVL